MSLGRRCRGRRYGRDARRPCPGLGKLGETWIEIGATEFGYVASGDSVVPLFRSRSTTRATVKTIVQSISGYWKLRDFPAVHRQPFYFDARFAREAFCAFLSRFARDEQSCEPS